jgi:GGDEF domain-containing protein
MSSDSISGNENIILNTLSRLGGDEFVVLLSELADTRWAIVASTAQRYIGAYMLKGHKVIITGISASQCTSDGEDAQSLSNMYLAMYRQGYGKNNINTTLNR